MKTHLEQNQEELCGSSISLHALYVRGLIIGINFQKQVKINAGKIERFFANSLISNISNLRSGSIFVLHGETSRREGQNEK